MKYGDFLELIEIVNRVKGMLNDDRKLALKWLNTSHPALEGMTPKEALIKGHKDKLMSYVRNREAMLKFLE